ncbi:serine hydrolase domain-containing protein [Sphingomonas sp.]|uniref:serine hydrolase domain-containing protein n=1 Tax=Sphingomonas sp. TaxID=28214 RepID=UPI003B3B32AA
MRMRNGLAILTALFAAVTASAADLDRAVLADADRIFADWQRNAHVPGLVYGIVVDGKLVHVRGSGVQDVESNRPVTADSLFRIASMSKAFTALAILKLRDEGKLSLDAPAETYVPEMRGWKMPTTDSPRITVRNLLTHSAGFVEDNPWGDRQQLLPEADFTAMLRAGVPFANAPGLGMEYSNFGYATLGRIVSNVSHLRYQDYIRQNLIVPLGMRSTGYDIFTSPPARRAIGYRWQDNQWLREPDMKDGAFGAMGGVETSANDYAHWVSFLLSAWPARDDPQAGPIARATVREIVTGDNFVTASMRNPATGAAPCRQAVTYGMAWRVIDDCDLGRVVTHTGGYPGYGSVVLLLPDKGVGLFAFASRTYASPGPPTYRVLLALQKAGLIPDRPRDASAGLASAYQAARAVWRSGDIGAAPLAMNMPLDQNAAQWKATLADLRAKVGNCTTDAPIQPVSDMEGRFSWICDHGTIAGRVQRAPTQELKLQALNFTVQAE